MKRILCGLFSLLMLFSAFTLIISAESTQTPSVMQDLAQLQIDGVSFDSLQETKFPVNKADENLYIITAVEKGFRSTMSTQGFELYFYVYNPSCQSVNVEDKMNSIQLSINEYRDAQNYYAVKIHSISNDKRFMKISLTNNNIYASYYQCLTGQSNADRRVYNVNSLRLKVGSKLTTFAIKRAFFFEGLEQNSTLTSYWKDMDVLEVELHTTNWISPNAGLKTDGVTEASVYDHYELHTIYFRVPKEYWEQYGTLWGIRSTYDAVHLTPIIVTRENDIDFSSAKGVVTKNAILNGTVVEEDGNVDIYDLYWDNDIDIFSDQYVRYVYTESSHVKRLASQTAVGGSAMIVPLNSVSYSSLAYYFATLDADFSYTDGASIAKAAVSSKALREYFYDRYDPYSSNSNLYSEYISNQDLSLDATLFEASGLYSMTDFDTVLNTKSKWEQWWTRNVLTESDGYLYEAFADKVEHIKVLENPSEYSVVTDPEKVANELFISEADMVNFSKVCREAASEGDYVVLLRIGFKDYRCSPVRDVWEGTLDFGPYVAVAVDKWVYLNVNVAELVYSKDGAKHSVPTVSNTVDSFGHLDIYGDPSINGIGDIVDEVRDDWRDALNKLKKDVKNVLLLVGIVLAVVVVLFVLWLLLRRKEKGVVNIVDSSGGGKRKRRKRE